MCSQVRNMSYASDNCRDGFSACSNAVVERLIEIYSVLFFPLVALLHRSTHRSLCERTFSRIVTPFDALLSVRKDLKGPFHPESDASSDAAMRLTEEIEHHIFQ